MCSSSVTQYRVSVLNSEERSLERMSKRGGERNRTVGKVNEFLGYVNYIRDTKGGKKKRKKARQLKLKETKRT